MKREYLFAILSPLIFVAGYLCGICLHPKISEWASIKNEVNITQLFGNDVIDLNNGSTYNIDTLSAHNRNLLIFWSPSCQFCRFFFNNKLNHETVGIFCFPLSDDYDYINFFRENHKIDYPQLVIKSDNETHPISAPFIDAIPTFIITDNHAQIIHKYVGIDSIDNLIKTLYQN